MISPLSATARSITLACQAVVSGRVLDSLTGAAPRGILLVRLIDRDTGKAYSLLQTILSDGSFAFHAAPERVFPRLAVQTYHLPRRGRCIELHTGCLRLRRGARGWPAGNCQRAGTHTRHRRLARQAIHRRWPSPYGDQP